MGPVTEGNILKREIGAQHTRTFIFNDGLGTGMRFN